MYWDFRFNQLSKGAMLFVIGLIGVAVGFAGNDLLTGANLANADSQTIDTIVDVACLDPDQSLNWLLQTERNSIAGNQRMLQFKLPF